MATQYLHNGLQKVAGSLVPAALEARPQPLVLGTELAYHLISGGAGHPMCACCRKQPHRWQQPGLPSPEGNSWCCVG